jgi:hypothetical protein
MTTTHVRTPKQQRRGFDKTNEDAARTITATPDAHTGIELMWAQAVLSRLNQGRGDQRWTTTTIR